MKRGKKIAIWVIIIAIVGIGAAYLLDRVKNPKTIYDTSRVVRTTLKQTVSSTGRVKSAADIDLNFKTIGKISKISASVGQQVKIGEELASLDLKDLESAVRQAEANLQVAQANLSKLIAGSRPESIAIQQATVQKARTAYDSAKNDFNNVVQSTSADLIRYENALIDSKTSLTDVKNSREQDIVNAKDTAVTSMETYEIVAIASLDVVDDTLNDEDASTTLSAQNRQYLIDTEVNYKLTLDALSELGDYIETAKSTKDTDDIDEALDKTLSLLDMLSSLLDDTFNVLLATITSSDLSELELDTLKTNIRAEQTNTNTAISTVQTKQQTLDGAVLAYTVNVNTAQMAVNTAEDTLNQAEATKDSKVDAAQAAVSTAKRALEIAEAQLALEKAPARREDIDLSAAQVKQSEAALEIAKNQLEDNILRAPSVGVITAVNYEVGEQSSLAQPVITMFSEGKFEIEVDISEADIAKVRAGNPTDIDFDAFGSDTIFPGEVTYIDPAETVIQDVVYYMVTIQFDEGQYAIKPGLTANVEIMTAEKKDVLTVVQRAIYEKEDGKYVKVLSQEQEIEKAIRVGLRGDDGLIEVVAGLDEGDDVIIAIKNGKNGSGSHRSSF